MLRNEKQIFHLLVEMFYLMLVLTVSIAFIYEDIRLLSQA